jgi:hypothetical protein
LFASNGDLGPVQFISKTDVNPFLVVLQYLYVDIFSKAIYNSLKLIGLYCHIYPPELKVKETTDTASSASFLDLYLEFDDSGQISTKIYDKRDDFNFKIINFPKYVQQYTSFSCIWCLHLAIDLLCKVQ